jgi:hypothetical protein
MSAGSNIVGIVREPYRDPARLADTDVESAQTNKLKIQEKPYTANSIICRD